MSNYALTEETDGYVTLEDPTNSSPKLLIGGSQNMLIDANKKVRTRPGYTRLGAENTALTPMRNAWTWHTSQGDDLPQRFYDDELEVYLGTVDTVAINAWKRIKQGWNTTKKLRSNTQENGGGGWFDSTEKIDLQIMCQGDANLYEWSGAIVVISSVTSNTITKKGTNTFAQSRAYSTRTTIGGSTTQFDITNPSGTTYRYTYDGTGTDPGITAAKFPVGMAINLQGQNFASGNKGSFLITGSGDNYFEITNAGGTAEANKTIGTGYVDIKSVFVCVRTGVEYAYNGGESTTAITGVNDTTGLAADDILIQKVMTRYNAPTTTPYTNDIIFTFQNQLAVGSYNSEVTYLSKNTSYYDFTYSTPRVPGEGAQYTLTDPTRAINQLGSILLFFSGPSAIFKVTFNQQAVGSTIAETTIVQRLNLGVNQGALNQECVVPVGNILAYLTNEVALRTIEDPNNLTGVNPKTLSNPIKPDFDVNDWTDAFGAWYKNVLIFSAPAESKMYMLNYVEDANGRLRRFWNPPQILPAGPLSLIDVNDGNGARLYMHSNAVPESYLLFDGLSDGQYADMDVANKLPIYAVAAYAYNSFGKAALLKCFDEFYAEGEIISTTRPTLSIKYDFEGATQIVEETIDGSDEDILEGLIGYNSLAQQALAQQPLGGLLNPPSDARAFRVVFEEAKEDFFQIAPVFSTNDVDQYWAIKRWGTNATLSKRIATHIRK